MTKDFKIYSNIFIILIIIKVFDIVRNILVATNLGVSLSADVYMGIITIPESILVLVGLDSIKGVVNSELSTFDISKQKEKMRVMFEDVFNIIFYFTIFFVIALLLFRKDIIDILLPGFSEEKKLIAYSISLIIFPVFFFKSIIGLFHSFLNALKKFYYPVLLNAMPTIFMIIAIYLPFYNNDIIYNLSFSVNFGHLIVLIISFLIVYKLVGIIKLKKHFINSQSKKILLACFSIFMLLLSEQLFSLSKNFFASYYGNGAISALNYSRSVSMVIIGLLFSSVFSVFLSNLSTSVSLDKRIKTRNLFFDTFLVLCFVIFLIVPFILHSGQEILSLLYLRGNFDEKALQMSLVPYYWESSSVISFVLYIIPSALFLAQKKYQRLNIIGSSVYLFGILLNYLLTDYFGYYGISMAHFFTTFLYGIVLLYNIQRYFGRINREIYILIKMFVCSLFTYFTILFIKYYFFSFTTKTILINVIILSINSFLALLFYSFYSYLFKVNILFKIFKKLNYKFNV